jgi:predicted PurR-regulated permease PerM
MAQPSKPIRAQAAPPPPQIEPAKPQTPAEREARMMATLTNSVFVLTVLACMATAHWLVDLLTPLMVAVFSLILIDAVARQVGRLVPAMPDWVRVSMAFVIISLVLVAAGALVAHSLPRFAGDMVNGMTAVQQMGAQLTSGLNLPPFARFEPLDLHPYFTDLLHSLRRVATDLVLVLVYLGFILASRRNFDHKVSLLFPTAKSRQHAQRVFRRVRKGAERYVLLQTLKGLMLGAIFWVVLKVFGMHDAVAIPVIRALAQYGPDWRPILMFISLQATVVAIDSVLLPRLQGERLDVDPVVVLVSLSFWSLIFGVIGALFSTVLTVMVIAIASEMPRLKWLAIVLSKKGDAHLPEAG